MHLIWLLRYHNIFKFDKKQKILNNTKELMFVLEDLLKWGPQIANHSEIIYTIFY